MQFSDMSETKLSEHIANYIRHEIQRRTEYRTELEKTPPYLGYDDFRARRVEETRRMLQAAIENLTTSILKMAAKHMPDVDLDQQDHEISISNILMALPPPQRFKRYTLTSGRG